jgi:hypothetical protein
VALGVVFVPKSLKLLLTSQVPEIKPEKVKNKWFWNEMILHFKLLIERSEEKAVRSDIDSARKVRMQFIANV